MIKHSGVARDLRERLGDRLFEKRLERQAGKRAKLQHQGEGVFRLEVFLEREGKRLWFGGIDDPHFYKTHDLAQVRAGMPSDECAILLSHSPETFAEAAEEGFHLLLSGHTHGGQICPPEVTLHILRAG